MADHPPSDSVTPRRVDTKSNEIVEDEKRHALARALRKGTAEMRRLAAKGRYMWPNPGELELVELGGPNRFTGVSPEGGDFEGRVGEYTVYSLRVARSCMPNPWADSIRKTARLPFRSRILLEGWSTELAGQDIRAEDTKEEGTGETVPGQVVRRIPGWVDNMDGQGRTLDEMAAEWFETALFEGVDFGFVDQDAREFSSPAERKRAGGRPYCTVLSRSQIYRISIESSPEGTLRIAQLVFWQPISRQDFTDPDDYIDEEIPALKVVTAGRVEEDGVITPVSVRLYAKKEEDDHFTEVVEKRGTITPVDKNEWKNFLDVPLYPLYGKRIGPWRGESPYLDSSFTQQTIWQQVSELLEKARATALAFLHESGADTSTPAGTDGTPVKADNRSVRYISTSQIGAKLEFVEQSGAALKELRELVEWLVDLVQDAHNMLNSSEPTGPVTAREITLRGVHASSALEMLVIFQEAGWAKILTAMAILGGQAERGTVSIPHDFGLPNSGMERNHSLFLAREMTAKNYWGEAQRAGDVDEKKFDLAAEIQLEQEGRNTEVETAARELMASLDAEEAPEEEP